MKSRELRLCIFSLTLFYSSSLLAQHRSWAQVLPAFAQSARSGAVTFISPIDNVFGFEGGPAGKVPAGWGGGPLGTVVADDQVFHEGRRCVRIERKATSAGSFSVLSKMLPMGFSGKKSSCEDSSVPSAYPTSQGSGCARTRRAPRSSSTTCKCTN
jgi:hypothetical protein